MQKKIYTLIIILGFTLCLFSCRSITSAFEIQNKTDENIIWHLTMFDGKTSSGTIMSKEKQGITFSMGNDGQVTVRENLYKNVKSLSVLSLRGDTLFNIPNQKDSKIFFEKVRLTDRNRAIIKIKK